MAFADELRGMNVTLEQRILASCNSHVETIVSRVRTAAKEIAGKGGTRVRGYIMNKAVDGVEEQDLPSLGNAPFREARDFAIVYSDLDCTGFNGNDEARISRARLENEVLPAARARLIEDGFAVNALRVDSVENFHYETRHGLLRDKRVQVLEGTRALLCYVDIAW